MILSAFVGSITMIIIMMIKWTYRHKIKTFIYEILNVPKYIRGIFIYYLFRAVRNLLWVLYCHTYTSALKIYKYEEKSNCLK